MFDGGASGSVSKTEIEERQSSKCGSTFGSDKYIAQSSNFSKNIYQGALNAWNQCQASAKKGLSFEMRPDPTMQGASVTFSSGNGSVFTFKGVKQTGSGRSTCHTTLPARAGSIRGKELTVDKSTSLKFDASSDLSITCERQMISDADGNLSADDQTLLFDTSAGTYPVYLGAVGLLSRQSADAVLASVQAATAEQIKQVRTDSANLVGTLKSNIGINCVSVSANGRNAYCPSGYIVTGCTAGKNYGSFNMNNDSCHNQNADADWTGARCCTVTK